MFYLLTVIFPLLLASSRCAKAIKNGSLRSFPELAKVLQQKITKLWIWELSLTILYVLTSIVVMIKFLFRRYNSSNLILNVTVLFVSFTAQVDC